MAKPSEKLLTKILESAKAHGAESEPEMEVGDLQDALMLAWEVMTKDQRRQVFNGLDLWES